MNDDIHAPVNNHETEAKTRFQMNNCQVRVFLDQ